MDNQPTTSATTLRMFTEALGALRVDWKAILREHFAADVEKLAKLIDRDLDHWL